MLWPSSYIAQIVKAKWYFAEPARFSWQGPNKVILQGDHHAHTLARNADGEWRCTCAYATQSDWPCSHIRALEMLLKQKSGLAVANLQALQVEA